MPTSAHSEAFAFEQLVEGLDDIVFRADREGRWTYLNQAWEKRLGWSVAASLGRGVTRYLSPSERRGVVAVWREALDDRVKACRREVRFMHADGSIRWMLVSARSHRRAEGAVLDVTGTITDITDAKAAAAELQAARLAAEAANKAKSEFLSNMSHELRTPLNAVIGLSESLLEFGAPFDPERTKRYLGIIHGSGRQLLAQINDILDLARIETGRIQVQSEWFDGRGLCTGAVEQAQRDIRAKRLAVRIDTPQEAVMINGDERLLRQVLQNLVSNAVKFTPSGGSIGVTLKRCKDESVRIDVTDTGIGIAAEKLPLLFRPFSQVDSSMARQFGGTGLGLVLVERLVRLHGGSVAVSSVPDRGSTFSVALPADICRLPVVVRSSSLRRVVLVDDDPRQHALVGDYLRQRGYEVCHFENGADALRAAATPSGLYIVDVNMPGMNGLEFIKALRRTVQGGCVPVLIVSALAEAEEIARCRAAGADAHLAKPVGLRSLSEAIERLMGRPA